MRSLSLALRGLWWRRLASLPILVVAVACAAIAAAGPAYALGSREAVLQAALRTAPAGPDGTGVDLELDLDQTVAVDALSKQVTGAFANAVRKGFVRTPIASIQGDKDVYTGGANPSYVLPALYRAGACARLVLVAGTCVDEKDPLGVMITEATAADRGWRPGTKISIGSSLRRSSITVRGVYRPVDAEGTYWLNRFHDYFGQVALYRGTSTPSGDAMLVPSSFWRVNIPVQGDGVFAQVDVTVPTQRLHLDNIHAFAVLVQTGLTESQDPLGQSGTQPTLETQLGALVAAARTTTTVVSYPIYIVAVQLVLLTWLVLYLVLVSSADSRIAEVVLGKLRGLSPVETILHALLEPLLLLVAAVPLGVYVAGVGLRAVAPSVLGPDVPLSIPALAWYAAVVAGLGGVVASVLASITLLRRPVLEQWRRAERRPRPRSWAVDAVIIALAVAGFVDLALAPSAADASDPNGQFVAALAPGLLAVAVALLALRAVPALARSNLRRTRGSPNVAGFVALRQVARRPGELRSFLLLAAALALMVLGVSCSTVFRTNQRERALTDLGADRVLSVSVPQGVDLDRVLDRLDPSGTQAAGVFQGSITIGDQSAVLDPGTTTAAPTALVVDPARFASVAHWRGDFGTHATLAAQLAPVRAAPPRQVAVTGTELRLRFALTVAAPIAVRLRLHIGLLTEAGVEVDRVLAIAPRNPGPSTVREVVLAVPCAAGCHLRSFGLVPDPGDDTGSVPVRADVLAVDALGDGSTTALLPTLLAASWTPLDVNADGRASEAVITSGGVLSVRFAPVGPPASNGAGYEVATGVSTRVPALATRGLRPAGTAAGTVTGRFEDGLEIPLSFSLVHVLPRAGDAGLLVSRTWLPAAFPFGYDELLPNQVWLGAHAPRDFARRLEQAGIAVSAEHSAAQRARQLGDQGPSFAVAMLEFGAIAAGVLAVAGIASSLLIASRRRLYEIAALRSLGVAPPRVLASLLLEQLALAVVGAVVGLAAGLVGARVALAKLPEFGDAATYPALLVDLPVWWCAALALLVIATLAVVVGLGGLTLVRRASPSRLREAQA